MTETLDKRTLLARLEPFGQQHLLQYWEELSQAQRRELAAQIEAVDLKRIDSLFRGEVDQADWDQLSRRAEPPPAVRLADRESGAPGSLGITSAAAQERGARALESGEVGVLLTAGGQGSRFDFELPKSMYPIGPFSGATLLQIHIEKVRALSKRYGVAIPLYLMTSPATHDDTESFLDENNRFGLPESDLLVFCQGSMPAVDIQSGKLLMADKHRLFLNPDGHGGT
ncbi:MAG: UTP--glucose-1-phosphate uridylyltransferase, partial [Planctomycetes bacterium]|nr:UTP--glucose-1-phosphate uridylyltransferase [Planctomycetota bacterium]